MAESINTVESENTSKNEISLEEANVVYHTVIKREKISGLLWLIWGVIAIAGGVLWNIFYNQKAAEIEARYMTEFEDSVTAIHKFTQNQALNSTFSWLFVIFGAIAILLAIARFVYAWDMKRDPVGIYSHYVMRLRGRIAMLIMGFGGGTLIAIYDIFTRKYVMNHREELGIIVNNHFSKN